MAIFSIPNIAIKGIASCVPKRSESNYNYDWITPQEQKLLVKTTGIENRRIAEKGVTTSDLCYEATVKLLEELKWSKNEVELLIFVSQSRDYFLPATSIILQDRLGLPKTVVALDISLGCSGYVYGLSVIASMMSVSKIKKGLLLTGDISSFSLNKRDKSTYPLFGDAGTATAIAYDETAAVTHFNLQSDGSGAEAIIIPDGGLRNPLNNESFIDKEIDKGIWRNKRNVALDGLDVFNFSISEVPKHLRNLLSYIQDDIETFDYLVFHQANKLILETIRKKLKVDATKVPYSLKEYGNTSSASIPLTISTELNEEVRSKKLKMLLCGFGVGLSWGTSSITINNICCPDVIEI